MSEASRQRGLEKAAKGLDPEWAELAEEAICEVVQQRQFFTVDHVWATGPPRPRTGSHIGLMLKRAASEGVTRSTGVRYESESGNHDGCTIWESLVCDNGVGSDLLPPPVYAISFTWDTIVELFDEPLDQAAIEGLTEDERQQVMRTVRDLLPGGRTLQEAVDFAVLSLA